MSVCALVAGIIREILNPLALLIFACGLAVFVWGIVEFLWGVGSDEAKDKGKQHMLWGIIGMAVMLSATAILNIIVNTFGLGGFERC